MNISKRVLSIFLALFFSVSVFGATIINSVALSENARYYESIPEKAYTIVGETFKIYYNNVLSLPSLKVVFNVPQELKKAYYEDRIEIKAELPGNFAIPWRVYDDEYVLVDSGEIEFIARDINLKNLTGIVIGDSTVNAGIVTQEMLNAFSENGQALTLLGTRGTYPNLHEGRGGWTATMYCTVEKQSFYQNPFLNNGFDFSYYMNSQGYNNIDFVIIQLGINDIKKMTLENYSSKKVLQYFNEIISSVRMYDSQVPIIIGVTIPPSEDVSDFNNNYVFSSEFEYRNNIIHFASDLTEYFQYYENVYFSAINSIIDTSGELRDLVHPTDVGYKNIAKQYVATINSLLNEKIVVKAPTIKSAGISSESLVVTWSATYGAKEYHVLRNGKKIAETTGLTHRDIDVSSGGKYKYSIKAVCDDGSEYTSASYTASFLSAPVLISAKNSTKGVTVSWNPVEAAENYIVYRKINGGKWSRVGTTTSTKLVDSKAQSGEKYFYTVRAENSSVGSSYDTSGVTTYYLATPALTALTNKSNGIQVKWSNVNGAKGYYVYKKTDKNSKWTRIAKTTGTEYLDKDVNSGKNYIYTVKAFNGSNYSGYISNGITGKYLSAPVLSKVSSNASGITLTYGEVTGATGYNIYRKTGNGSWEKIAVVKNGQKTSYLDKTAQKGKNYTYTVRAINGKCISSYNTKGLTIKDKY